MTDNPAADDDNPEWTKADFARAVPASDVFSADMIDQLVAAERKSGLRGALPAQHHWARGISLAA